jgi:hypothetical protein
MMGLLDCWYSDRFHSGVIAGFGSKFQKKQVVRF